MTAWNPVWQLSIDGGTFQTVTLANLTVTSGRTDIYQQPVAGYCTVEIINTDQSVVAIDVNECFKCWNNAIVKKCDYL